MDDLFDGDASTFSGVVRVDRDGQTVFAGARGLADRARGIPNTVDTRFAVASCAKTFTALAVLRLVEDGVLRLDLPVREVLGTDLALVDDRVTVEQLLSHRSGIGDYLDEYLLEQKNAYVLSVPVHTLDCTEAFVPILEGFPQKFPPGEDFAYCNGGFVVLALVAERVSGVPFVELVHRLVCEPAGLASTAFLRSDELPGDAALHYLDADSLRTNVLHLPVIGNGDGGIYTTAADVHTFWDALFAGRIVAPETVAEMTRQRSVTKGGYGYGLGVWLWPVGEGVQMEGADAGVSFRSTYVPRIGLTYSILSNWTDGAWPVAEKLDALIEQQLLTPPS